MVPVEVLGIYTIGIMIGASIVGLVALWWIVKLIRG